MKKKQKALYSSFLFVTLHANRMKENKKLYKWISNGITNHQQQNKKKRLMISEKNLE